MQLYFFATSCPNNAQWMTRYYLELLYSDEARPAACAMLEAGAMFIQRTNKPFFRTPSDWNLEQIMSNSDDPCRLKRISFSKSVYAFSSYDEPKGTYYGSLIIQSFQAIIQKHDLFYT